MSNQYPILPSQQDYPLEYYPKYSAQPINTYPQPVLVAPRPDREVGIAYLFLIFLGIAGGHQFYLGKTGRGIFYLFTFAGFTLFWWIDLFTLSAQVRQVNTQRRMGIM